MLVLQAMSEGMLASCCRAGSVGSCAVSCWCHAGVMLVVRVYERCHVDVKQVLCWLLGFKSGAMLESQWRHVSVIMVSC